MRPPNYTLLMIWIPVILLASVVGYLKRENLYMLYDTRYWAVAAMVCVCVCSRSMHCSTSTRACTSQKHYVDELLQLACMQASQTLLDFL